MARKQIPLKDKKKVIKALAMGKTFREAKEGTVIASTDTVQHIANEESNTIEQIRQKYLLKIENAGATEEKRAQKLAEALDAKKRRRDFETGEVWYEPDHKIRLETIKYIDELKGIAKDNKEQPGNTINNFGQMIMQSRQERGLK